MPTSVRLADVTADNWRAVVNLKLAESQRRLLASNVYSLAQSKFDPDARPRAIYAGETLVGFIMYDLPTADGGAREASIYRFMIDVDHQRKGYGRAALACAIAEIAREPNVTRISISYLRDNPGAREFYASAGFVETGETSWGETVAVMTPPFARPAG